MRIVLLMLVVAVGIADARELVEVEWEENSEHTDLTGTGLTRDFCGAEGMECPGSDLEAAKFAPTARQCYIRCAENLQCLNAVYDANKDCHLRANRCTEDQLEDAPGALNLFRLKDGEQCDAFQPAYSEEEKKYSGKFCLMYHKSCPMDDRSSSLYKQPQTTATYEECLIKCLKINSCTGVDYKDGKCDPKSFFCSDDDLVDNKDNQNYLRLELLVNECPKNRVEVVEELDTTTPPPPPPPPTRGTPPPPPPPPTTQPQEPEPTTTTEPPPTTTEETTPHPNRGNPYRFNCGAVGYCYRERRGCCHKKSIHCPVIASAEDCKELCSRKCWCVAIQTYKGYCWLLKSRCKKLKSRGKRVKMYGYYEKKPMANGKCPEYKPDNIKRNCKRRRYYYYPQLGLCRGYNIGCKRTLCLRDCQAACDRNCRCQSIQTYRGVCWLKRRVCKRLQKFGCRTNAYRYYIKTKYLCGRCSARRGYDIFRRPGELKKNGVSKVNIGTISRAITKFRRLLKKVRSSNKKSHGWGK